MLRPNVSESRNGRRRPAVTLRIGEAERTGLPPTATGRPVPPPLGTEARLVLVSYRVPWERSSFPPAPSLAASPSQHLTALGPAPSPSYSCRRRLRLGLALPTPKRAPDWASPARRHRPQPDYGSNSPRRRAQHLRPCPRLPIELAPATVMSNSGLSYRRPRWLRLDLVLLFCCLERRPPSVWGSRCRHPRCAFVLLVILGVGRPPPLWCGRPPAPCPGPPRLLGLGPSSTPRPGHPCAPSSSRSSAQASSRSSAWSFSCYLAWAFS